jgi:hypothetical protein
LAQVGGSVRRSVRRSTSLSLAAAVVAGVLSGPAALAGSAAAGLGRTGFAVVEPAVRAPAGARMTGATDPSRTLTGTVALRPRDPRALRAAATAVSTPHSAGFHHYLATGGFAARYGASRSTVDAVSSALTNAHLTVTGVARDHLLVHFRGSVRDAEAAFRTRLADYRLRSGRTGHLATSAISLPAAIADQVQAVIGLNTMVSPVSSLRHARHPAATAATGPSHPLAAVPAAPHACRAATAIAGQLGGLTDEQIANAYGVAGLYRAGDSGAGQRIGVFELEPFSADDLNAFDRCYFPATYRAMLRRTHTITVDGGSGTGAGSGESILDIEDVEALAPNASVDVYEAPPTSSGSFDQYARMINDDRDSVITTSWGFCELDESELDPGYINVEAELFEQAALQGQTVLSASGDAGADSCAYFAASPVQPHLSVSDPTSQPFVTGVGGTTISSASVPPTERVWNDGNVGGGSGGGVSAVWGAPSWQSAVANTDRSAVARAVSDGLTQCAEAGDGGLCRQVPDVSAVADEYTGGITMYASPFDGWTTIGGTSSASPLWAAMLADVNASAQCAGSTQPHGGVGFVSPALYAIAAVPSEYAASFHDVTAGNNDVYDVNNGRDYRATPGYDLATGLGTPALTHRRTAGLTSYLCAMGAAQRPSITSVTPSVTPVTPTASTLVIAGSGFGHAPRVSVGGYDVPSSDITVTSSGHEIDITPIPTAAQAGTGEAGPQDGSGRHLVSVTASNGTSSVPEPSASVLYVDTTGAGTVPSVSGVGPYGGAIDGPANVVTVYGAGFAAAGGVTGVTVGGVPATGFTVKSDSRLSVTIPPYLSGTTGCAPGDDPTTDVCQSQVVVSNANGHSAAAAIHPPLTGAPFVGRSGGAPAPACVQNATCEVVPATTEYDYLVRPHIASHVPRFSSEDPSFPTIATITGKGFDYLGLDWVNIGPSGAAASADVDFVSVTPTRIQFTVSGHRPTNLPVTRPLSLQTLQGLSNTSSITYAGVPKLTRVRPRAGPDTGGTRARLTGSGFFGVDSADGGSIQFEYLDLGFSSVQLSGYAANARGTSISETTPANNPGRFIVEVCTVTSCSSPPFSRAGFNRSLFDFFDPGDPVVTSLSAHSGPASGGTRVRIFGRHLSDVTTVRFGNRRAAARNLVQVLTNGSNNEIVAIAPPGVAGRTVSVVVRTQESDHGGHPSARHKVDRFRYVASVPAPPRHVRVIRHGTSPRVHWSTPLSDGGYRIRRYRVIAHALKNSTRPGAKAPRDTVVIRNRSARAATLSGLRAGWFYVFKVRAVNRKGPGRVGTDHKLYLISQPAR